jgi:hypothetical protein
MLQKHLPLPLPSGHAPRLPNRRSFMASARLSEFFNYKNYICECCHISYIFIYLPRKRAHATLLCVPIMQHCLLSERICWAQKITAQFNKQTTILTATISPKAKLLLHKLLQNTSH